MSAGHLVTSHHYADACAQEQGLPGWWQSYCQLQPGRYAGRVDRLDLAGVSVMRERINIAVSERTAPPPGRVVFVKALAPQPDMRVNAVAIPVSEVLVLRGAAEQAVAFGGASDVLILTVDEAALDDGAGGGLPSVAATPADGSFEFHAGWVLSLLAGVAGLEAGGAADLALVLPGMITDRLAYLHARLFGQRRAVEARGDMALFRRALAVVEDADGEPLAVGDLARRLGVPAEALRAAFVHAVGVGPGHWLRCRRLDGARRDLIAARRTGATVSEVATRWGFWHFGRFARSYADQFGESPSATARAGRG